MTSALWACSSLVCKARNFDSSSRTHVGTDEIHFRPPIPPVFNILGGAGAYSALGARLLSPPPLSKSVGGIVDAGTDFPLELRETISSWRTSCLLRETPDRLTTRGWNGYGENEQRGMR